MPSEKGTYRSIYSAIWEDPEFQAFDPDTMLVFFSLRTCRECNFPCIFPYYQANLYERIKLSHERIDAAFSNLLIAGWIEYERPVLWILKGLKNDPNFVPNNNKQILGIANILKSLPKLKIVDEFASYYHIPNGSDARTDTPRKAPSEQGTGEGTGTGKEQKPPWIQSTFELPAIIDVEIWKAFEEHRKKLRKPMTDRARDLIIREIMKLGQDPNELLEQSIRKGWQDVFPIKDQARTPALEAGPAKKPEHLCWEPGCERTGVVGRGKIMWCREHDPERHGD